MPWFSPRRRTVIVFDELHVGRSLRKAERRSGFTYTIDRAFDDVIASCAGTPRGDETGTWIGPEIIAAYRDLHRAGDAHSVEVWRDDEVVGGFVRIDAGGVFTGESMFHRAPDASSSRCSSSSNIYGPAARAGSIARCDPHMEALGARQIARSRFLDMLAAEQARGLSLF